MIARIESRLRAVRRALGPGRLLTGGLKPGSGDGAGRPPGLILIQIDGLSRENLETAIARGNMRSLARLRTREYYRLHSMFSGVPSSTPSVQAELFHGLRPAVPSFSFFRKSDGRVVRMLEPEVIREIEKELLERGSGLLEGGSGYSNMYAGGRETESHFSGPVVGWRTLLQAANPMTYILFAVMHTFAMIRMVALLPLELILALFDFLEGSLTGFDPVKEIKFIAARILICITLREVIVTGARMDIARGLPVIHMNFLGYDEQAHRRGPTSLFAHWTLRGIDDAIRRIRNAALDAPSREYDVWIYSDHGQEDSVPYPVLTGRTIQQALLPILDQGSGASANRPSRSDSIQALRAGLLRGEREGGGRPAAERTRDADGSGGPSEPTVVAMGPLGHVYAGRALSPEETVGYARRFVREAQVPLVLIPLAGGEVLAVDEAGEHVLPRDAERVLGADHPHLSAAVSDLVETCHHPDAGDLMISGWRREGKPVSFPVENGSHAGPGSRETDAFALLPADVELENAGEGNAPRPLNLRHAALRHLRRMPPASFPDAPRASGADGGPVLRIMTWNVHSCIGMDGRFSPRRISRVIAQCDPDVVCLQELDAGRGRTGGEDQAEIIAGHLRMEAHFHPAVEIAEEKYGDAILSRVPMELLRADVLPGLRDHPRVEPRGALMVRLRWEGESLTLVNTHLGLRARDRQMQIDAIMGETWLGSEAGTGPSVLCGDFNALPGSPVWNRAARRFLDVQVEAADHRPRNTWFGRLPLGRIDHIFVDRAFDVVSVEIIDSDLARIASDHLPLVAGLRLRNARERPRSRSQGIVTGGSVATSGE